MTRRSSPPLLTRLALPFLLPMLAACASKGGFNAVFAWQGGQPPPACSTTVTAGCLPAQLWMYAYISAPDLVAQQPTAGPTPYSPGASLPFQNVPVGQNRVIQAQLRASNAPNAEVLAYGQSAPFDLTASTLTEVTVPLLLHTVIATPASGGVSVLINGVPCNPALQVCVTSGAQVSLELIGGAGTVGVLLSNGVPPTAGEPGTLTVPTLTADPNTQAAEGFRAFRYSGWNLFYPSTSGCAPGQACLVLIFAEFIDSNGVPSAPVSTAVTMEQLSCGFDPTCATTDNATCAVGCPSGSICSVTGVCATPGYTVSANGTVTDQVTGLVWQQATSVSQCAGYPTDQDAGFVACEWADAQTYCNNLQLGGYNGGWRLPTIQELFSLVDEGLAPRIDSTVFPGVEAADYYWSSTAIAGSATGAWYICFGSCSSGSAGGFVEHGYTMFDFSARCVR